MYKKFLFKIDSEQYQILTFSLLSGLLILGFGFIINFGTLDTNEIILFLGTAALFVMGFVALLVAIRKKNPKYGKNNLSATSKKEQRKISRQVVFLIFLIILQIIALSLLIYLLLDL